MIKGVLLAIAAVSAVIASATSGQHKSDSALSPEAARGRYLVVIAGCNDCHTPGYTVSGGKVDEKLFPSPPQ